MYVVINPTNKEKTEGTPDDDDKVDFKFAQEEIAKATGFATGSGHGLSKGLSCSCCQCQKSFLYLLI